MLFQHDTTVGYLGCGHMLQARPLVGKKAANTNRSVIDPTSHNIQNLYRCMVIHCSLCFKKITANS